MKQIPLTKGKVALVDDEDHEYLNSFNWHATKSGYARRRGRVGIDSRKFIWMHHQVFLCSENLKIDHRDGNGFNNQKGNLRPATHSENCRNRNRNKNNSSGYKGVSFHKGIGKFTARLRINYQFKNLGVFNSAKEAAEAYDWGARCFYGTFARTNKEVTNEI